MLPTENGEVFTTFVEPPDPARDAWLKQRLTGLGASDAAAVFGVSPYKSPLALYYEKRGEIDMPVSEREALYWGRILQSPIAVRYANETGRQVIETPPYELRRHPTHPHMIATLDALATATPTSKWAPAGGPGNVEIKNAGFFKREDWRDEPPLAFQIQAQHQMFVTGCQWGSIAALVGGVEFFWTDIQRNNGFIEVLVRLCGEFWARVTAGTPPEPDASESTRLLLKQLYPKDTGEIINLGPEYSELDEKLQKLKADAKKLQEERAQLENKLKLAMGSATAATFENGSVYTFKTQGRREFVMPATEFRVLRKKGE